MYTESRDTHGLYLYCTNLSQLVVHSTKIVA